MKILFNLQGQRSALNTISQNDIGTAHAILSKICCDQGLPVEPGYFNPDESINHQVVYGTILDHVNTKLFAVPTPDIAVLTNLGNLQFQLTLHNREI
ncbi:hypothetical protein D5W64_13300 [Salmonella enterica subsp. enterica serovar Saintpaul]|nr:hypothetical protein [Salmonella enterica subsp. enterica serovar Saintpaul]